MDNVIKFVAKKEMDSNKTNKKYKTSIVKFNSKHTDSLSSSDIEKLDTMKLEVKKKLMKNENILNDLTNNTVNMCGNLAKGYSKELDTNPALLSAVLMEVLLRTKLKDKQNIAVIDALKDIGIWE